MRAQTSGDSLLHYQGLSPSTGLNEAAKLRGPRSDKGLLQAEGARKEAGYKDIMQHRGGLAIADIFKMPPQAKRSAPSSGKKKSITTPVLMKEQVPEMVKGGDSKLASGAKVDQPVAQSVTDFSSSQVSSNVYSTIGTVSEGSLPEGEHDLSQIVNGMTKIVTKIAEDREVESQVTLSSDEITRVPLPVEGILYGHDCQSVSRWEHENDLPSTSGGNYWC
ncbi:hypothetical protein NDU88_004991 [Pleurodeles waltl]|uniref:Uncharacterized protein n=1 Tax=Pleurodeles waltl TaxID=8319 RepID=A0AAV7UKM8_PLEWA|nr:hypothetical protein NDU88_004991 [Pleurodeles waltl]